MLNSGDTAWVLASAALVMLMTPGLAFFYGGMVRSKSVLNMLMMNFIALAVVGVLWVLLRLQPGVRQRHRRRPARRPRLRRAEQHRRPARRLRRRGRPRGRAAAVAWPGNNAIPLLAFAMFQLMFAVITPALISGAIADRVKFWSWTLFVGLWSTIVYFPVAHWVFSFDGFVGADAVGGWIANDKLGALDFAGGTAVHINAGAAGLALAIVLGKRRGWPREPMRPHNLPFVLLGAGAAVVRLVRLQRRFRAGRGRPGRPGVHQHHGRDRGRGAGLADRRADPRRQADHAWAPPPARWPAWSRSPRPVGSSPPLGAIAIGVIAGAVCALAVGAEVPVRLRRLARRGRRAPGRRSGRHPADRLLRHHQRQLAGRRRPVLRRRRDPLGKQAVAAFAVLVYSFVRHADHRPWIKFTIGFRITEEAEAGASTRTSTRSPRTTSRPSWHRRAGYAPPSAATAAAAEHIPATAGKES